MSMVQVRLLPPLIKVFDSTLDFVTRLVNSHANPSTLIVCGTECDFIETLLHDLRAPLESREGTAELSPYQEHMIVTPTLHLLAKSQSLRIAYVPTLPHLRAYLATFCQKPTMFEPPKIFEKPGSLSPTIALLNPLMLHRHTGDLSAQGLSRTFSLAVEAANREGLQLVMTEIGQNLDSADTPDSSGANIEGSNNPWQENVPLLNSSLRFRGEERAWAGKTIKVGQIASRWYEFEDCRI